jgi:hypothetical protein
MRFFPLSLFCFFPYNSPRQTKKERIENEARARGDRALLIHDDDGVVGCCSFCFFFRLR